MCANERAISFSFSYFLKRRIRERENCVSLSKKKERERDEATTFLVDPNRFGTRNWTGLPRAHLLKRKEEKKNTGSEQQISAENNSSDFLIITCDAGLGLRHLSISLSF